MQRETRLAIGAGSLPGQELSMRIGRQGEAARATHRGPVVSEHSTADEADLVVLAMQTAMGPGEPVRAKSSNESLEELGRHAGLAPLC